ncbi:MAG TPA: polysaccharide biosynthesis protein [Firmicutes bacterium]|jgi:FlaA1/EpsC-like NDP-sugar epimerase|nr:polysaccharide biosynthesis protein [Bacillota bacterium]
MFRWRRGGYLVALDVISVNLAFVLALFIRFDAIPAEYWQVYLTMFLPVTAIRVLSHYYFGLYRRAWRYASIQEAIAILAAVTVGTFLTGALHLFWFGAMLPRSIVVLDWFWCMAFVGGSRFLRRVWAIRSGNHQAEAGGSPLKRVLIVGAGDGGALTARELRNHYGAQVKVVGYIDDDPIKQNQTILGYPVLGTRSDLLQVAAEQQVDEIVISMPSVPRRVVRELVNLAQQTGRVVKILPGVYDLLEGNVTVSKIREVQIEDLLGRDPVIVDLEGMSAYLSNKVVLVTGAGGSIGSELCRQIAHFKPKTLLLLDFSENNLYDIEMELKAEASVSLVALVKDIQDGAAIDDVFQMYKPEVVFHAAAHKHVPLMEQNPEEAIKNNVYGTYQVARAAHTYGAKKFVLVSTDKAVNPTSVMGASKRIAEMIIQYLDSLSETSFVAVRFGNVLGSRGSVIPLFRKQIMAGGPVTVTHEKMIRYFMTIPEAVQLVLQAGALASKGEIFVLDMGEPVRIMDLAETLIRLSGFKPYTDIDIKVIGMRPGEKLFEELLTDEEGINATNHERIFVAKPAGLDVSLLQRTIADLEGRPGAALPADPPSTIAFIQRFIPEFRADAPKPAELEAAAAQER